MPCGERACGLIYLLLENLVYRLPWWRPETLTGSGIVPGFCNSRKEGDMDNLLSGSPWGVKMLVYGGTVLLLYFALYAIPLSWLQRFGKWPGCSANWVTLYRLPITWVGIAVYLTYKGYWGFTITVFGYLLDFMDGRIAKAQQLLKDPKFPGVTEKGKVLDPAIDKGCVVPHSILLALTGLFSVVPCLVMAVIELTGTLIRPPFIKLKWRWLRPIKRRIRRSDATGVGKVKMVVQCTTLIGTVPYTLGWWSSGTQWMTWVIWGIVILAAASVASRLRFHKLVDEGVDSFTLPFNRVHGFFSFLNGNGKNGFGAGNGSRLPGATTTTNGRKP